MDILDKIDDIIEEGVNKKTLGSYLTTALWSSTDSDTGGNLDDKFSIRDIDKSAVNQAKKDLDKFFKLAKEYLEGHSDEDVAHDFWLTRNHHGAGFWDGDYEHGDILTKIANKFKEVELYVGDDGKIYD